MTIVRYTTAPFNGPESDVEYVDIEDARAVAQKYGLQLIERTYVFNDSELIEDYTRWHWVVSTRVDGDTLGYLPEGPDVCTQENPDDAVAELGRRFEGGLAETDCELFEGLGRCGQCDPCSAKRELSRAVGELDAADVERDKGFTRTIHGDTGVSLVFTIARVLLSECPIHEQKGHEK